MNIKKKYLPITIFCIVSVVALWITGYTYMLDPRKWTFLCMAGYALPAALAMIFVSVVMCVCLRKRLVIIPLLGMMAAYYPVTLYCPIHTETEVPEDAIKVLSYNLENWGMGNDLPRRDGGTPNTTIKYLSNSNADIICMQECNISNEVAGDVKELLENKYKHHDKVTHTNGAIVEVFSRFPIRKTERIPYESFGNVSGAFWLDVKGREVILIVNHFETMGLSLDQRDSFKRIVEGRQDDGEIRSTSKYMLSRISEQTQLRAAQVDAVAQFIRRHAGSSMIVCGDFNDIPHSYTHYALLKAGHLVNGERRDLIDCYHESGIGPGYSFNKYNIKVRIDNILCSPDMQPYNCTVDKSIDMSDHYPIYCWLKLDE